MKELIVVLLCVYILAGCASHKHKIKYGKVDRFGRVYYPLCERSKQRITELQNISFELPDPFKQVSCKDEGIYHLHTANDLLNISTPSTVRGDNGLSVYSMQFSSGIWYSHKKHYWMYRENTFSPEVFLEYKKDWHQFHGQIPIEYGWVNVWSGGRCARFQFRNDSSSDYIHEVQYYCWPHSPRERRQVPFRISATQSIAKKVENISVNLDFTDIDNELIKPVMDSLEFHPLPDEALQFIADRFDRICHLHHSFFYKKTKGIFLTFLIDA